MGPSLRLKLGRRQRVRRQRGQPSPNSKSLRSERSLRETASTAEVASLVKDMLLDGLRASKTITANCTSCGKRQVIQLPDLGVRINAARGIIEELEGKQRAESSSSEKLLEAQTYG